ncbi:hypothetical protein U9M48_019409 [Paspalum notatum var. saurae]|uniref:Secreted protein n=1 Tax=Paspalum notatum var. saurae TaxID=547442 RepID=A0AAQ3WQW6_PASNO
MHHANCIPLLYHELFFSLLPSWLPLLALSLRSAAKDPENSNARGATQTQTQTQSTTSTQPIHQHKQKASSSTSRRRRTGGGAACHTLGLLVARARGLLGRRISSPSRRRFEKIKNGCVKTTKYPCIKG